MISTKKPRIAWFSPLPNAGKESRTISEYCSELLLPILKSDLEIECFHNRFDSYKDFPTFHFLTAAKRHQQNPFDAFFYQMEDESALNFIRIHLGIKPGIVWFHDFIYSTDGPEPILNSPWEETIKKFNDRNRPWAKRGEEYFKDSPIAYREGGCALIPAFSSPRSFGDYSTHIKTSLRSNFALAKDNGPWLVNIPVEIPQKLIEKPISNRIAFCGFPGIEKRYHKLLTALSNLNGQVVLDWLVLDSEKSRAEEAVRSFGVKNANIIVARSANEWRKLVKNSFAAYHCHFSAFGGMREYLPISMSEGVPVITSSYGDGEHLPSDLVFKIDPGSFESRQLEILIQKILADEVIIDREALRKYALEHYSIAAVSANILSMINQAYPLLNEFNLKWTEYESQAQNELAREAFEILSNQDTDKLSELKKDFIKSSFNELRWKTF
ncbi:MAG: glycosyltransferase [Bdellovibrionales bacterium]|nr:glycosyltransferase [Bdellovibrionales bacterium]